MNADLRNALHDLAEGQEFRPDPDVWDRGRRARRRSRIVAGAAAIGVVAVVAGVGALVTGTPEGLAPAERDVVPGGAVPSRIEQVSDGLEPETDLAIGRGSAAFVSTAGDPVVIGATDGKLHVLDLLGWEQDQQSLALSPDGEKLAWQGDDDIGRDMISVLDLESGNTELYPAHQDSGSQLRAMSWSPDSSRLAWLADPGGVVLAGQVRTEDSEINVSRLLGNIQDVAVSDRGMPVVSRASGGLFRVDSSDSFKHVRLSAADHVGAGAFSPDGRYLALRSAPDSSTYTLDMESRKVLEHPFPADTLPTAVSRPLGWLDNRLQLLLVTPTDGSYAELVVTTPQVDDKSTWRRRVGSVDPDVADTLSLAVDLVPDLDGTSSQQLTHDFGEPDWPGDRDISWMIGLGVAAAIAVLMGARRLWRWSRGRRL